jgi:hypothetical protein
MPMITEKLVTDLFTIINKNKSPDSLERTKGVIGSIAATAEEVLEIPRIKEKIRETEFAMIRPLLSSISTKQKVQNNSEIDNFIGVAISTLLRSLPSEELVTAINDNKKSLVAVLNVAKKESKILDEILNKCELNGENLVEFIPTFCSQTNLKSFANCVENPSAANIANLLLSDPRIMGFAIISLAVFCKNCIKDVIYKAPTKEVNIDSVKDKVNEITPLNYKEKKHSESVIMRRGSLTPPKSRAID